MSTNPAQGSPSVEVFEVFADLVEEHYVLADRAAVYAERIRAGAAELAGRLPDIVATNSALHHLVPDRHLALRDHDRAASRPTPGAAIDPATGGIRHVGDLGSGICLVEIHPVFAAPEIVLPHLRHLARQTSGARGMVLDLRRCFGGDTDTAALIHGWFLGPRSIRIGRFEHRGRPSQDYRSNPAAGVYFAGGLRILTSAATFSGGEDLAYVLQALGRGRVVGERTGGGAHPVEHFGLPGGRMCQIPVARSVIDVTGSNWEGVGVIPDTACPAEEALERARQELDTHAAKQSPAER